MDLAPSADLELEPVRQRIDHRDADAVQAAGHLVGVLVEFSAGVELGHDDLGRRYTFRRVQVGRDAAAIVGDGARAVRIERYRHQRRVPAQRFVDGVVHHLVDHVVQARAVIRIADIHARTFPDGVEALQDLDGIRPVFGAAAVAVLGLVVHAELSCPCLRKALKKPRFGRAAGSLRYKRSRRFLQIREAAASVKAASAITSFAWRVEVRAPAGWSGVFGAP